MNIVLWIMAIIGSGFAMYHLGRFCYRLYWNYQEWCNFNANYAIANLQMQINTIETKLCAFICEVKLMREKQAIQLTEHPHVDMDVFFLAEEEKKKKGKKK